MAVLTTPFINKGTAFTAEEREALGLTGLLPPVISTLDDQKTAAYIQYQRLPDALSKNIYLTALHDRNEVLFFGLLSEHLREMIPIVNDRTVGLAMEQSSTTMSAGVPEVCTFRSIIPMRSRKRSGILEPVPTIST